MVLGNFSWVFAIGIISRVEASSISTNDFRCTKVSRWVFAAVFLFGTFGAEILSIADLSKCGVSVALVRRGLYLSKI
jgi:hypothetical protein